MKSILAKMMLKSFWPLEVQLSKFMSDRNCYRKWQHSREGTWVSGMQEEGLPSSGTWLPLPLKNTKRKKKYKEDVKELIMTLIRIKRPHSPSPTKKVKNKSYITSLKSPNAQMQRMFFACCRLTTVLHLQGGNQLHITEETLGFGSGVKLRVPKGKGFSPY